MILNDIQMKQLRKIEVDILKRFIDVCNQLSLTYFLVQGTLLGAVRHQGFIPWDDDIDVGMPRKDYDIFLSKGQSLLPSEYFVQTHDTDFFYTQGYAKIRFRNSAFVETTCKNLPINHGIYIDIFPFDYYPDNIIQQITFELDKFILRYRVRSILYIPSDNQKTLNNCIRHLLMKASNLLYPSLDDALNKQASLYAKFSNGKKIMNNGSPWGRRECVPARWFSGVTTLDFEGVSVNAPICYREYLSHVYGDYMELPPMEKRVPHHYICALSFTEEYKPENNILERKN